jgi:2-dehydro-3-deoxyphosphogluconate aldolase/(4S)-4-hydroxy-2-oxoglutarate aldolase
MSMDRKQRQSILDGMEQERVSAIIRTNDEALARQAMQAAIDGGFRLVEFTLTTPGALALIREFAKRQGLTVGAGTVMTQAQAREAVGCGARFLVSPVVDAEVIAAANALDVPIIPGAATPTEMETARRHGADLIKVFPAPAGGVEFIQAIRGPLPHLRLFPTAGVTPENFIEYLDAGCFGVGFVRSLFDPADLSSGNFGAIRARAEAIAHDLARWRNDQ